ncbi:rhodanese-like domain-containing protein [Pseudofulvibacter geojedonensis]|uniref:Rhodanese-like domain-containing protein n=1 Tax=Pseudofulvibacter geojedonensis TaxID=1123758 RepID=A0ABW3I548_9FLAO
MIKKFFLAVVCIFFSCKEKQSDGIKVVGVNEFSEVIDSENVQILDVRTPSEVANGKIDKAIEINFFDKNFKQQVAKLDKNKVVVVYCKAGGRSNKAAHILNKMGFKEVYDLDGGYTSWKKKK